VRRLIGEFDTSERRVCELMKIPWMSYRYQSRRDGQAELRMRLRDLAGSRVRYGYRRLTILLRREGWKVNAKRIYRLYREEGLQVQRVRHAKAPRACGFH
jgi:putative transposase